MNSNSAKNTFTVANRISDNNKNDNKKNKDDQNTGKVSLVSNDQTFSTKDDIEWNNEEKLKGGRDLEKRSLEHHGRKSVNDGHVFAFPFKCIHTITI